MIICHVFMNHAYHAYIYNSKPVALPVNVDKLFIVKMDFWKAIFEYPATLHAKAVLSQKAYTVHLKTL